MAMAGPKCLCDKLSRSAIAIDTKSYPTHNSRFIVVQFIDGLQYQLMSFTAAC
jgi:hypothetical protein